MSKIGERGTVSEFLSVPLGDIPEGFMEEYD